MKHAIRLASLGLLAGAAVTLAASGVAQAHGRMGAMSGFGDDGRASVFASTFADLDADGSGLVTQDDLTARAGARFDATDADGDGKVTVEELSAAITAAFAERAKLRPGATLPQERAQAMAERMLAARDADKSGALEAAELQPRQDFARLIDRFDTDDDNAWSAAEFDAAKAEIGARFERGRDGRKDRGRGWDDHGARGGRW